MKIFITDSDTDKDGAEGSALLITWQKAKLTIAGKPTGRGRRMKHPKAWMAAVQMMATLNVPLSDAEGSRAVRIVEAAWRSSGHPITADTARDYVRKTLHRLRDHVRSLKPR